MKQLDKLLIKNFIGPFIVTFGIAMFVLIMQTLWVYLDEIVGKGASILMITELIFYLSVTLFPLALLIAILISSVMVMGNLAEHYELTSFKSAGVPLVRIMMPLAFMCTLIGIFSFYSSNTLMPISNLQFRARLHDIRKQKPTLSLEERIFNDDFQGFTIYIGKKHDDGQTIEDILIYDQSSKEGRLSQISAKKGRMYSSPDNRYFIMNLYNGTKNEETGKTWEKGKRNYSFTRTNFKEYSKTFDLTQFDIKETDKDLFKSHEKFQSVQQLNVAIDSLDRGLARRFRSLDKQVLQYFYFEKQRDTLYKDEAPSTGVNALPKTYPIAKEKSKLNTSPATTDKKIITKPKVKGKEKTAAQKRAEQRFQNRQLESAPKQFLDKPVTQYDNFLETFIYKDQKTMTSKAKASARSIHSTAASVSRKIDREKEKRVKHIYQKHIKFSHAVICIVFLFIGAPMGAIVRKGGFGYPILVAVLFFMLFIVLSITSDNFTETFTISPVLGAWLPCIAMTPIGIFLSYKAMKDIKILNFDKYLPLIRNFFAKIFGKKKTESPVKD